MMRRLIVATLIGAATVLPATGASLDGEQSYDLLFREGTLDAVDRADRLTYYRKVESLMTPDAATRGSGRIELGFERQGVDLAQLTFRQQDKHRSLGNFPASVGNPVIMVFYESVIRDMAEATGGSPFYIRNRVKDALIQPSEMEVGEAHVDGRTVPVTTITMRPFSDDPNRERMQGFGDLEMRVTMSDAVPGWYVSLVAEAVQNGSPVYRSEAVFDGVETAR